MNPRIVWLVAALALVVPAAPSAHPLAPSLLELHELGGGAVDLVFRTPLARAAGSTLEPVAPASCKAVAPGSIERDAVAETLRVRLDCGDAPLAGREAGVRGLAASGTNALLRVIHADGRSTRDVLGAGHELLRLPEQPSALASARAYLWLGVVHILTGVDHLLFVIGLCLLVRGRRALVLAVTSFTLGHAATLAAVVLAAVRVPSAPIEIAIAASVFLLAVELARGGVGQWQRPAALALGFGLLHGFGFAAALVDAGLPGHDIPLALAAFNLGIETGQLAVVALVLALSGVLRGRERALAYALGSAAGFWLIERSAAALGVF